MDRKAYKVLSSVKRMELSKMGGSLATPTAPQVTDVSPNRWGGLLALLVLNAVYVRGLGPVLRGRLS